MNAEEMFGKLGYKKGTANSPGYLGYERFEDDKYFSFDLISKEIMALLVSIGKAEIVK